MDYRQILGHLYSLESSKIKLGLKNIKALLKKLGNPEKELKCIHVAGTNGKGSVCAMLFYVLREAGYNVGLYTSPHLKKFNERIRFNDNFISDREIVDYYLGMKGKITNQSFFEITTAMAFLYFKEKKVDFVVLEVGLGGRLDATNVVKPLISIITNIDYEHTNLLGNTLEKIAYEKAGIIKIVRKETKQGATANFYALTEPAFVIKFKDFETTSKIAQIRNESEFLEPFIRDGQLDALIIVGSPDPHGPDKARSRDGYYGMDLALFLGTFLNYVPQFNVKLDTEVRDEDLQNNLILIGGPVVNKIVEKVNSKLPIRFENGNIKSTISSETYPQDECGLIVKAKSPFNKDKYILVVAGKRFSGTRAAIIAFLKDFKKITNGNVHNPCISLYEK